MVNLLVRKYLKIPIDAPCEVYAEKYIQALRSGKYNKEFVELLTEVDDLFFWIMIGQAVGHKNLLKQAYELLADHVQNLTMSELQQLKAILERLRNVKFDDSLMEKLFTLISKFVQKAQDPQRLEVLKSYLDKYLEEFNV